MLPARPLPSTGSVYLDARGGGRALRVSLHLPPEAPVPGLVVLSLWRHNVCIGSFQLDVDEVPDLIATLQTGLDVAYLQASAELQAEASGDLAG